jgi:hypothetical protein
MLSLRNFCAVSLFGSICGAASATTINHTDLTDGASVAIFALDGINITVTSSGGNFQQKTVAGLTATGISGGTVDGEIDSSEFLTFSFDQPVTVTSMSIAHLFRDGHYGDTADETAEFATSAGNFQFVASGVDTGDWNGFGAVANDSPAINNFAGGWTIAGGDVFGFAITSLVMRSGNPGLDTGLGDFGFRQIQFAAVPAPGALALLGLFVAAPRRRRD